MKVKCNRKKIDWYSVRLELGDFNVDLYYWLCNCERYYQGYKQLSKNRRSYYALRHVFGDQVLNAYRLTGDLSCFYVMQ